MAADLPPAVQDFIANLDEYDAPIEVAKRLCDEFADANENAAVIARQAFEIASQAADEAARAYAQLIAVTDAYERGLVDLAAVEAAAAEAEEKAARATQTAADAMVIAQKAADALRESAEALAAANEAAAESEEVFALAAERTLNVIEDLVRENVELGASYEAIRAGMEAVTPEIDELIAKEGELAAAEKATEEVFKETVAAIVAGETAAGGAVQGFVGKLLEQLAAVKANQAAIAQLREALAEQTRVSIEANAINETLTASYGQLSRAIGPTSFMAQALGERMQALADDTAAAQRAAEALTAAQKLEQDQAELLAETDTMLAESQRVAADAAGTHTRALILLNATMSDSERDALGLTTANVALAASQKATGASTAAASQQWAIQIGWWRLSRTAIHWIIAGTFEFMAVFLPAMIAAAAGAAVAAQGAQNLYDHLTSVYTATEATANAFHTTTGDVLGMGHSLQAAQNAADPGVYEILGSVVADTRAHFTDLANTGLDVVHMLDQLSARITMDLSGRAGAEVHQMLSGMDQDLQEFGEILGNVGHSILNLAAAMPGIAHNMLLPLLAGFTGLLRIVTSLPAPIITTGMALEEFYRWGGLVAEKVLVPLTRQTAYYNSILPEGAGFVLKFGAALQALGHGAGFALIKAGQLVGRMAGMGEVFGTVGTKIAGAGSKLDNLVNRLGPAGLAGTFALAVGGAVALGIAFDQIRNKTQQFIDSVNQAVAAASTNSIALHDLAGGVLEASTQIAAQENVLRSYTGAQQMAGKAVGGFIGWLQRTVPPLGGVAQGMLNAGTSSNMLAHYLLFGAGAAGAWTGAILHLIGGSSEAASKVDELTTAQRSWITQARNIVTNGQALAHTFGTSLPQAMSLADMAGVQLNANWKGNSFAIAEAITQIHNLEQGWTDMQAPASTLGHDITAVGIQTQLAATKVQQLNQAWDQWVQSVTSGTQTMSQLQTSLLGMDHAALTTGASLTGTISTINHATGQSVYNLKGFGQAAMQSWQQFDSSVQTGNSAIDTLQTGLTEGVVKGRQFTSTVKAMVGEMLPFTQGNKAAVTALSQLAYRAGGPVTSNLKTLAAWAGIHGPAAMHAFVKSMEDVQTEMGNVGKVASNLSAIVSSQVEASMVATVDKTDGLDSAVVKLSNDMANAHTPASTIAADESNLRDKYDETQSALGKLSKAYSNTTQAEIRHKAAMDTVTGAEDKAATATQGLTLRLAGMGNNAASAAGKVADSTAQKLAPLPARLKAIGDQAVSAITNAIHGGVGKTGNAATAVSHAAVNAMKRLPPEMHQAGADATQGLADGILSQEQAAVSAAGQVADAAANAMRSHLQTHSPSKVTIKIGQDTVAGLIKGLTGGIPQIDAAIKDIVAAVKSAFQKGTISLGQKSALVQWVQNDNAQLQSLANQRKAIAAEISAVNAVTKAAQSSFGSIIHPFSGTGPTPLTAKQLAAIPTAQQDVSGLQSQLATIKKFAADLKKLAALGLAPALIQKIIAMGPVEGDAYAQELIKAATPAKVTVTPNPGGPQGGGGGTTTITATGVIAQLNSAYAQITAMSKSLANQVGGSMYGAGVQGAAGLVKGLKSQEKAIDAEMAHIAKVLVDRIKHDLKIHSPSLVMVAHGMSVAEGLARGIRLGEPLVVTAMRSLAEVVAKTKIVSPPVIISHEPNPGGTLRLPGAVNPGGTGKQPPIVSFGPLGYTNPGGGEHVPMPLPAGGGSNVNPGGTMSTGGGTLVIHVHGHVLDGKDLGQLVRKEVLQYTRRNWQNGLFLHGRAS